MAQWQRLVVAANLLGGLGALARGGPPGNGNEEACLKLWRLERLAAGPHSDAQALWAGLVRAQRLYPASAAAARGRQLLAQVRSPLDTLDPRQIPKAECFAWQPKGLVAVLGTQARRHWGEVGQVAFSPDGKQVASTSGDGLRLWDAATMRQNRWLKGIHSFSFAPDGKTLAVAEGNIIRLCTIQGDRLKRGAALRKKGYSVGWFALRTSGQAADGPLLGGLRCSPE